MRVVWRALLTFVRRALLSLGPVAAVAVGAVLIGAYASGSERPATPPDLGRLQQAIHRLESRADCVSVPGTGGDDVIAIAVSARGVVATVNGRTFEQAVRVGRLLAVMARGGDDTVIVSGESPAEVLVSGGAGDDHLVGGAGDELLDGGPGDDTIEAGAGDDLVDAGAGDDDVALGPGCDQADGGSGRDVLLGEGGDDYLQGGRGDDVLQGAGDDDVLYGLDGHDQLVGGAGGDYLDGGAGSDDLCGDGGHDVSVGGAGYDTLRDSAGRDLLAGGASRDAVRGGTGSRVVPAVDGLWPSVRAGVRVADDGHGFAARAASDLAALAALPIGRELLAGLAASGRSVVLRATAEGNAATWEPEAAAYAEADGRRGGGADCVVLYNPYRTTVGDGHRAWQHRPPVVGLFHELVHALAVVRGTMSADDGRRQAEAVGADAGSAVGPTENGLRGLLGLPLRPAD